MTWLTDVLERMVSGRINPYELAQLLPWAWKAERLTACPPCLNLSSLERQRGRSKFLRGLARAGGTAWRASWRRGCAA